MNVEKLDFSLHYLGEIRAVKARVFEGVHGGVYASIDGPLFNGWELSLCQLEGVIEILERVRDAASRVADA